MMSNTYNEVMIDAGFPVATNWTRKTINELRMIIQSVYNASESVKEMGPSFVIAKVEDGFKMTVTNRFEDNPIPNDSIGLEELQTLVEGQGSILVTFKHPDIWVHTKEAPIIEVVSNDDPDAHHIPQ